MIKRSVVGALASALLALPATAHGQSIRVADSLLQSGSLARADSLFYAAARVRPRDPIARWALGRYLVARGATRVGATLFEESLRFGGEPSIAGRDLVPVYLAIGEFRPLARSAIATPAERARARWLASHRDAHRRADSGDRRRVSTIGRTAAPSATFRCVSTGWRSMPS